MSFISASAAARPAWKPSSWPRRRASCAIVSARGVLDQRARAVVRVRQQRLGVVRRLVEHGLRLEANRVEVDVRLVRHAGERGIGEQAVPELAEAEAELVRRREVGGRHGLHNRHDDLRNFERIALVPESGTLHDPSHQ
jgi:hypothetical protein